MFFNYFPKLDCRPAACPRDPATNMPIKTSHNPADKRWGCEEIDKESHMKITINHMIDHRSLTLAYLPQESLMRETLILPGAGCSIGCCSTSCGATAQQ